MQQKTEIERPLDVQESRPLNHPAEEKKSYKAWIAVGIILLLVAGILTYGIVSRIRAKAALSKETANKAIVDANQANVQQFQVLKNFEKVYAPFDGVITARNTDIGDLISSGNTSASGSKTDLFHISQPGKLRVYVNVPEEYSRGVKPGKTATEVALAEFPGRRFPGKLVRTAEAINVTTRTLLAEVDVANPSGNLLSGSYAEVHLK